MSRWSKLSCLIQYHVGNPVRSVALNTVLQDSRGWKGNCVPYRMEVGRVVGIVLG